VFTITGHLVIFLNLEIIAWFNLVFKGGTPKKHSRATLTKAAKKILAKFQTY
jgi:hypothetical protein